MSRNEGSVFNKGFDLFDPFFDDDFFRPEHAPRHENEMLRTDVVENENNYELVMDVPGMQKEDVQIEVEDGYLTITATKQSKQDETKKNYVRRERYSYSAKRSFYVGNIKEEDIKAKMDNGELHIMVPKESEQTIAKKHISIE